MAGQLCDNAEEENHHSEATNDDLIAARASPRQ